MKVLWEQIKHQCTSFCGMRFLKGNNRDALGIKPTQDVFADKRLVQHEFVDTRFVVALRGSGNKIVVPEKEMKS